MPRSHPVPLGGLLGGASVGSGGLIDGILYPQCCVLSPHGTEPRSGTLCTLASPEQSCAGCTWLSSLLRSLGKTISLAGERGVPCCSFLLHDSTMLVAGRSPPLPGMELFIILCLGQHFAFYQEASELWRQVCLYYRFYKASSRMLATEA